MLVADIIMSVLFALAVTFFTACATQALHTNGDLTYVPESDSSRRKFAGLNRVEASEWLMAVGFGVLTGVCWFFSGFCARTVPGVSMVCFIVMVAMIIYVMIWWGSKGGEWKELPSFIILLIPMMVALFRTALYAKVLVAENAFGASVVGTLPLLMLIVLLGFMPASVAFYRWRDNNAASSTGGLTAVARTRNQIFFWVATGLAALMFILAMIFGGIAWGKIGNVAQAAVPQQAHASTGAVVDNQRVKWLHYYNLDLQNDGDDANDFNFGPNPYKNGKSAADYDAELRERMKWDTALAAADTAWLDANVGTRYLGTFYESCKEDWALTINDAAYTFSQDQQAYYKNLDAFFAYLDHAKKVEVRECSNVTDQMYMNPFTKSGVPDVIVLLTDNQVGHELVYTFEIKGNTFEVAFRIECGFQPTNVQAVMGITPQNQPSTSSTPSTPSNPDNPVNPPEPTPPEPTPPEPTPPSPDPPSPDPPQPDPPTPPEPEPKKDPSELTPINTEPNDDTGPGPDTNNPDDPEHSIKDRDDNSTSYDSYDDYRADIEEKEQINNDQKVGGDSNQPSTETPSGTTVDNNAENGTGNGGIDKPTEVSKPAETSDGSAVTKPGGDGAWGDGTPPE